MNPSFHKNSFVAQPLTSQRPENDIYDQSESEVDQLEYSDSEMSKYASTITGAHQKENISDLSTNTQRPNTPNDEEPSSTRQKIISTPSPGIKAPALPVNTPRPFPLTPPQPSQVFNEPTSRMQTPDGTNDSKSDSDSLPEVADMLARMRPTYSTSQVNQHRSITARDDATRDVNTNAGSALHFTPVKRHDTESPRVPKSSYKPTCTIVETPKSTIIEILDSDTDGEHPPQARSKISSSGISCLPSSHLFNFHCLPANQFLPDTVRAELHTTFESQTAYWRTKG
ncbi:hypothetical protein BDZ94DRAFT_627949 [Collybia nuda]|uniref:Uncharacterized protein n=1 Tax=Collybia nuda TaxID=64659 RepID=A0A9P6CET1_9AGAR|nr:hypothetical protein BDZ94DRAFT_627949 [Collybia nuda]